MTNGDMFWQLDALSNEQVLSGLHRTLRSGQRLTAELVAHLGEVEDRRLHLDAACSSMFGYCVTRLRLSEDEACRRIDVARLARRFPAIFPLLARGEISLSVVALLKPHLTSENASRLLAAVSCKSVQRAREVLAAHFPRPDVPPTVRKLPEPRPQPDERECLQPLFAAAHPPLAPAASRPPVASFAERPHPGLVEAPVPAEPAASHVAAKVAPPQRSTRVTVHARAIEPLAASRYKVQFTAGAELKAKLELARDLMRHAAPNADLAVIIEKGLDRLIADLMNERFGVRCGHRPPSAAARQAKGTSRPQASRQRATRDIAAPPPVAHPPPPAARIPRAERRAVVERDGLRCGWVDDQGNRCEECGGLEYDHRHPRGKGGASNRENLRLLCRAHNRRAAELEYGREHIERAIAQARRDRRTPSCDAAGDAQHGRSS